MSIDPVFDLGGGRVTGWRDGAVLRASGIAYAQAPRWQAPELLAPRDIIAKTWAPAPPQRSIPRLTEALPDAFARLGMDEDCLRLSITRPADGSRDLPVMVWLHGGSYESGAGDMAVFDPAALVAENGVIVVSVTARLGLLGWLARAGVPANLGLMDLMTALRWIRAHIAGFGGDPGNVTLFGQSSGGHAAAHLMIAEGARDLFQRVIIQSAPLALSLRAGKLRRVMAAAVAGLAPDAPLDEILAAQDRAKRAVAGRGLRGQMPFGPHYGAAPLPAEHDLDAAWAEVAPRCAVLLGHMRDEAALFLPPPLGGIGRLAEPLRKAGVGMLTQSLYARPARRFAARHLAAGGRLARYAIAHGQGRFGAAHLAELPLLFPCADWLGSDMVDPDMTLDELTRLGRPLRRVWADFAREGRLPERDLPDVMQILPPPK